MNDQTRPCTICERDTPTAELTPSGRCVDCVPGAMNRPMRGMPGPGRQAVRQMLAPYRARKAEQAQQAADRLARQRETDTTVMLRRDRP